MSDGYLSFDFGIAGAGKEIFTGSGGLAFYFAESGEGINGFHKSASGSGGLAYEFAFRMGDCIGAIPVPEIPAAGVFPIIPDYPYGRAHQPQIAIHQFGGGDARIEQRFLLGVGARRFTVRKAAMRESDRIALRDFWEDHHGPYSAFIYNAPNDDGNGTTPFACRFADEPLSWEFLSDAVSSIGLALIEIPGGTPGHTLNETLTRFPSSAMQTALLSQVQEIIPLVKIQPRESGYPGIYVSDRRCRIGNQLYQARLLGFDGISQSIGNESDEARFAFGNADRVMRDLANDTDLFRASIEFSLFHAGTGIKLDLWKGEIVDWQMDAGPEFSVTAADGIYELNLPYPTRRICRDCWKHFDDSLGCPFTLMSSGMDYGNYPNADPETCDKGYDTDNGCKAHGMKRYFGGILAEPQSVRIKDNSQGFWGFGRPTITSSSIVNDSVYDQVMPEIYTKNEVYKNANGDTKYGRLMNCKITQGRDESEFYAAIGIVGEGPIEFGAEHKLDGQLNHLAPNDYGRCVRGYDPAGSGDYFSLDAGGVYLERYAAGTAFLQMRRTDEVGLQLSYSRDHSMQAVILQGLSGWVWTAAGQRGLQVLSNPIWIAINMMLRSRGLKFADVGTAELYFDVDAAIEAAAICDESVSKLIGSGTETQFKFQGIVQEEKPLRDWIQEVLMNCLGYYTFAFGKLKLGIRSDSSPVEDFDESNILFQSLQLAPLKPSFNHLTANFADAEYNYGGNTVTIYDINHARQIGGATAPLFLKSQMNLAGISDKSPAARLTTVRLREELGGVTPAQWKAARNLSFKTNILALNTIPGMVCSMTHPDMPDNYGQFRVTGWKLNKDYSIDVQGRTTMPEMYDVLSVPISFPQAWAFWKLDEASGTRYDSSGNGRHLAETSGTVNGDNGWAHFDVFTNQLWREPPGCPNLNGKTGYTYAFWFKPKYLSYRSSYNAVGFNIVLGANVNRSNSTGKWRFEVWNDYADIDCGYILDDETEHLAVIYFDGSKLYLEIDNVPVANASSDAYDYDTDGYSAGIYGAYQTGYCEGWARNFGIWEVMLTPAQRAQLWNGGAGWSPY